VVVIDLRGEVVRGNCSAGIEDENCVLVQKASSVFDGKPVQGL
jgi:hypothetical protein